MSPVVFAAEKVSGPEIDWLAISPLLALVGGACLVLMAGLLRAPFVRHTLVPFLALVALGACAGLTIATWGDNTSVIADAMVMDDLTLFLTLLFIAAAMGTVQRRFVAAAVAFVTVCWLAGMVIAVVSDRPIF